MSCSARLASVFVVWSSAAVEAVRPGSSMSGRGQQDARISMPQVWGGASVMIRTNLR